MGLKWLLDEWVGILRSTTLFWRRIYSAVACAAGTERDSAITEKKLLRLGLVSPDQKTIEAPKKTCCIDRVPDDPPGACSVFLGFLVTWKAEVSVVDPMAYSSMFVLPSCRRRGSEQQNCNQQKR